MGGGGGPSLKPTVTVGQDIGKGLAGAPRRISEGRQTPTFTAGTAVGTAKGFTSGLEAGGRGLQERGTMLQSDADLAKENILKATIRGGLWHAFLSALEGSDRQPSAKVPEDTREAPSTGVSRFAEFQLQSGNKLGGLGSGPASLIIPRETALAIPI